MTPALGSKSKVGKGFNARYEAGTGQIVLFFGESQVASWPVASGFDDELETRGSMEGLQRRVDQFIANRLAEIISNVERWQNDEDEAMI